MFPFKRFIPRVSSIRVPADWFNSVSNMLEGLTINMSVDQSAYVTAPNEMGHGWALNLPLPMVKDYAAKHSFDISIKSATLEEAPVVIISEGYFNKQGATPIQILETELELPVTSTQTFIYAEIDDDGVSQILAQDGGTRPQTDAGIWRKVLYEVAIDNGMPTVSWDRRLDFDVGSPI
jgi:hypothetical protein